MYRAQRSGLTAPLCKSCIYYSGILSQKQYMPAIFCVFCKIFTLILPNMSDISKSMNIFIVHICRNAVDDHINQCHTGYHNQKGGTARLFGGAADRYGWLYPETASRSDSGIPCNTGRIEICGYSPSCGGCVQSQQRRTDASGI